MPRVTIEPEYTPPSLWDTPAAIRDGFARLNHDDTSRAAYQAIEPKITELQRQVVRHVRLAGKKGTTVDELLAAMGEPADAKNTIAPRVTELSKKVPPPIYDSGERRLSNRGAKAAVWIHRDYRKEKP